MVSDKKNTPRKAAPNPKANSCILGITYLMVALFLGLAVYMGYFLQVRSEDVINNSYNARLDRFSDRIVRGKIMAGDGTVLAETQMAMRPGCIIMAACLTMRWAIPPRVRQELRRWLIFTC